VARTGGGLLKGLKSARGTLCELRRDLGALKAEKKSCSNGAGKLLGGATNRV